MRARTVAFVLTAALIFYFFVVSERALILIRDGRPAFLLLGVGVVLLPIVGAWTVWRELQLGFKAQQLGQIVGDVAIDFESAKASVEGAPEDWRAWYVLALAYGQERDTKNGRAAMRKAVELKERESGR